jgi:hypothetical protein
LERDRVETVKGMWLRVRSFETDVVGIGGALGAPSVDASALLTHLSLSLSLCSGFTARKSAVLAPILSV